MTASIPPTSSRKPAIAVATSVACIAYALSLVVQRAWPHLKELLLVHLDGGITPTYYMRVVVSLAVGAACGALVPATPMPERTLAWATGIAVAGAVILICVFP